MKTDLFAVDARSIDERIKKALAAHREINRLAAQMRKAAK